MDTGHETIVIKRDGTHVKFDEQKIRQAIGKACVASGLNERETETVVDKTIKAALDDIRLDITLEIHVEDIQDIVEENLLKNSFDGRFAKVAKKYILYKNSREVERNKLGAIYQTFGEIVDVEDTDIKKENANINGNTPAGQMMKFASIVTNDYSSRYLIQEKHSSMHSNGLIHIHDRDFGPTRSTTCAQYDLQKLFTDGFYTQHGKIKEPQSIKTYAALAAIAMQSNQNEQHGGQAVPAYDHFMAPGVRKSFKSNYKKIAKILNEEIPADDELYMDNKALYAKNSRLFDLAVEQTKEDTFRAMESFIYNMCTMHSRGKKTYCLAV